MNARMEQIKTRLDATSGGPWCVDTATGLVCAGTDTIAQCGDELDARFIAGSREDVAYLLNQLAVIERICDLRIDDDSDLDKGLAVAIRDLVNQDPALAEGAG